jgi:phosphate/sulfate permease
MSWLSLPAPSACGRPQAAACWRVAGAIAALGAVEAGGAARVVGFDAVLPAVLSAVFSPVFSFALSAVLGTTLRAMGRALGSGTFDLAAGSFAQAYDPTISASVVAIAVERNAAKRADRVTAFLFRRITKD